MTGPFLGKRDKNYREPPPASACWAANTEALKPGEVEGAACATSGAANAIARIRAKVFIVISFKIAQHAVALNGRWASAGRLPWPAKQFSYAWIV